MSKKKTNNKKIKDNPSIKKLEGQVAAISLIGGAYKLASKLRLKNKSLDKAFAELPNLKKQIKSIVITPDKFNEYFSNDGWIATETMNFDLMQKCVELAEKGSKGAAEKKLVEYYGDNNNLTWLLRNMNGAMAFRPRSELADKARIDHIEGRYHASIPIILMIMDGIVNDVSDSQTGMFAKNTDVEVWDTIIGHSSGLNKLKEIFTKFRGKTNNDKQSIPYRNGILHNRDINYDNEEVSAKTWAALFAVGDWAKAKQNEKYQKQKPPEKELSWREHFAKMSTLEEQKKLLADWKARDIVIDRDVPATGKVDNYGHGSPERKMVEYIEAVKSKNYGKMAILTHTYSNNSVNKRAASMREMCNGFEFNNFKLLRVTDDAPAITEIEVEIAYAALHDSQKKSKSLKFRLINYNKEGKPTLRGFDNSKWKILTYELHQLI